MAKAKKITTKTYSAEQMATARHEAYLEGQQNPTASAKEQFREIGFQQGYKAAMQSVKNEIRAYGLSELVKERAMESAQQINAREFV